MLKSLIYESSILHNSACLAFESGHIIGTFKKFIHDLTKDPTRDLQDHLYQLTKWVTLDFFKTVEFQVC